MGEERRNVAGQIVGFATAFWGIVLGAKLLLVLERHGYRVLFHIAEMGDYLLRDAVVAVVWTIGVGAILLASRARPVAVVLVGVLTGLSALYIGLNIPFFRAFSTPLNSALLDMSGGAGDLQDSVVDAFTLSNVWPLALCMAVAIGLPFLGAKLSERRTRIVGGVTAASLVLALGVGLFSESDARPRGLDRNALWEAALIPFPRDTSVRTRGLVNISEPLPRGSIYEPERTAEDLSELIGVAEGMNIVLVVLESTSARYLGAYGAEGEDPMPRVSALIDHSLVFDAWRWTAPMAPLATSSPFSKRSRKPHRACPFNRPPFAQNFLGLLSENRILTCFATPTQTADSSFSAPNPLPQRPLSRPLRFRRIRPSNPLKTTHSGGQRPPLNTQRPCASAHGPQTAPFPLRLLENRCFHAFSGLAEPQTTPVRKHAPAVCLRGEVPHRSALFCRVNGCV